VSTKSRDLPEIGKMYTALSSWFCEPGEVGMAVEILRHQRATIWEIYPEPKYNKTLVKMLIGQRIEIVVVPDDRTHIFWNWWEPAKEGT